MKFVNYQFPFPATVTTNIKYYDSLDHSIGPEIDYFLVYYMSSYVIY